MAGRVNLLAHIVDDSERIQKLEMLARLDYLERENDQLRKRANVTKDVEPLLELRGGLPGLKVDEWPMGCGVYFLWSGTELVYVGKSRNLGPRIWNHIMQMDTGEQGPYAAAENYKRSFQTVGAKVFDYATWLYCEEEELDMMEASYIDAYRPDVQPRNASHESRVLTDRYANESLGLRYRRILRPLRHCGVHRRGNGPSCERGVRLERARSL